MKVIFQKAVRPVYAIIILGIMIFNILMLTNTKAAEPVGYYKYKSGTGCPNVCENIVFTGDNPSWYNCIDPNDEFDCTYVKCTCVDNLPRN